MRALGGLAKVGLAGAIAWAWANGHLTRAINATIAAFSTPPEPKTPTFPTRPGGARGGQGF